MNEPLAIVGMACRLPGADGLDAFWQLVVEGRTSWGPLPESRFDRGLYFHPEKSRVGKSYSEVGAVVSDRPVDAATCPITPEMLGKYDVAHHVFLEVASLACRDAGLDPFAMPADRRTGVYVGHTGGSTRIGDIVYSTGIEETATLLSDVEAARALLGTDVTAVADELTAEVRRRYPGRAPGEKLDLGALAAAKIVQEALRLDGPYLVVDAACASSLQAMAIGARALLQGGIDQAIVGGASYCKSDSLVLFSAAQSVSNRGSCPFGEAADGLVTAEGYVALVIKTLARAVADGDRIRAVIHGLGVASDGKGKSLWAPRQEGQVLAVERAYPHTEDLGRIEYIEAHATSTQVGDATELAALSRLMKQHLPAGRQIPIGSVKANIGHTLETAGMASLVKVVLAMEHGVIPPGSTCTDLNSEFDWAGGPFTVPRRPLPWPKHADGAPRCAAVNAFGIGGLNVHVSLAEHVPAAAADRPARPRRTPEPDAIAIVGAGCVLPGAFTLDAFFNLLDRGETAIGRVPPERWNAARVLDAAGPRTWHTVADQGGFVRGFAYDWRRHKVPPKQIAAANPLQFMLLEAADAAIADAGGPDARLDRTRTGVVVGTLFGGEFANQLQMGLRLPETGRYLRAALLRRGVTAADADRVIAAYEKKLLERMPALVDETGSFTSSTLASRLTKTFDLMGGALALDAGDCSSVSALAAAADMLREGACDAVICAAGERSMDLMAFEGLSLGGLLAAEPTSVLAGRTTGGDIPAEAAVVLVLKRLADARAAGNRIRGVIRGVSVGSGRTTAEALRRVVREADELAGIAPAAVRAVEVTIAGGQEKTREELAILAANYARPGGPPPVAGAVDGLIGHPGAAVGAVGIVAATRALTQGTLPGTAALVDHAAAGPALVASHRPLAIDAVDDTGYRAAAVTVVHEHQVGHVVIDNGLPVPDAARPAAIRQPARPAAAPAAANATAAGGRPLVAALFPGQGSQYTDMFRGLAEETGEGRQALARLDVVARATGHETLAEIAWRAENGLGTRIWDTQWAMYLGDLFAWHILRDMGFAPDVVASHSFGEFPALAAAGSWSVEDGARAARGRADAVERHGPRDGGMLSIIADRKTVASILEPFAGQAWLCAENAPQQSVVGGTARAVDAVEVVVETRRVKSKRLAVPSPFHTPLLAESARHLEAAIRGLTIVAPGITTYSSTTVATLGDEEAVRRSLVRQMTETVRWVAVVEQLHAAGVRTFVEVGPAGVLTGLTRRILEGREGVNFVQFDQRGRPASEHLARLREQLLAVGAIVPSPSATPAAAARAPGRIVSFDATARRRQRNRSGAAASRPAPGPAPTPRPAAAVAAPVAAAPTRSAPPAAAPLGQAQTAVAVAPAAAPARPQPADRSEPAAPRHLEDMVAGLLADANVSLPLARAGSTSRGVESFLDAAGHLFELGALDRAAVLEAASLDALCEVLARAGGKAAWLPRRGGRGTPPAPAADPGVETFLVDFVVEQTGYPREIVELDADLEADLGIDSIRKAQLFGEIGQKYGLTADDSVSLDDFRTLRHLLDYLLPRVGGGARSAAPVAAPAPTQAQGHGEIPAPSHGRSPVQATPGAARPSAAFARGFEAGCRNAGEIRRWARLVTLSAADATSVRLPEPLEDELAGIADGAGVAAAVVRAAYADPAAAVGGCDAVVVAPTAVGAGAVGLAICVGRDADPAARAFVVDGLRGVIVSAQGLPGGVAGWNDAGVVAVAGSGPATGGIVAQIVESCRTIDDVRSVLATCARPPVGLVVATAASGVATVDETGALAAPVPSCVRADARAPLARVMLADGDIDAASGLAAILDRDDPRVRAAVSATAAWLAVGSCGGDVAIRSGGTLAADWIPDGAAGLGPAWAPAAAPASSASAGDVTRRYTLGMRDAGEPRRLRSLKGDRVLIVGGGPLATALGRALEQAGATPLVVECGSAEEAIAAVERAEESGAVHHLVVTTARRSEGDWRARRGAAVVAPFFACQRWLMLRGRAGDVARATLTATVDLGGDFGVSGPIGNVTGGAIAGLFKGIARETAGLHVRVIDAPTSLADAPLAAAVVAEIQDGDGPVEIGLVAGRRVTLVPREERPARGRPLAAVAPGSVWIVTGGARGVTAACARELGRRHGLSLVLLGSTHPVAVEESWLGLDDAGLRDLKGRIMLDAKARGDDPRAAWRTIEKSIEIASSLARFRAAGVAVRYEPCNLADAAAVRQLVARVARDVGPIRGIVHGAGYEAACRFEKKTLDGLEATLAPKCAGLEHLLAAVDPATLETLVAFGSTSGRLGGHGQADYSLANDMLAKIVGRSRRERGLRSTAFHWHAWDEVGMASRPESRFVLEQFGLRFMPLAEGVRRFMDEIEAGLPDAEVLVTEPAMCPDAVTAAAIPAPRPVAAAGSLVECVEPRGGGGDVVFRLDPAADRFLLDHLQHGRPLLPAVMGAELLAQAAIAAGACDRVTEIRDFSVERPIGFPTDQPREVRVELVPTASGIEARGLAAVITADGRTAGEDRVHIAATVSGGPIDPIRATLDEPPFPFNPMVYQEDAPLKHGPAFRTLTGLFLDRSGGWGRLVSLPGDPVTLPRGGRGWTVPVALLDGCIVGCAVYSFILCGRRVEVPVRFDRLRLASAARDGEKCTVRMLYRSHDARESIYDLVLFGDDGRAILAIDGLHLAVMSGERSPPA